MKRNIVKRYVLSQKFISLSREEQIKLLTKSKFKAGYWLKKNEDNWFTYSFCAYRAKCPIKDPFGTYEFTFDVTIQLDNLNNWNDYDNVGVIDDDFGQYYGPFYDAQQKGHSFPFLDQIIIPFYHKNMEKLIKAGILEYASKEDLT